MKICLVSALPPYRSGISLYTMGLLAGFEKVERSFSMVVIANKSANEIKTKNISKEFVKAWTNGPRYPFQIFSSVTKSNPLVVHFQHEFFLYGGIFSSSVFPALLFLLRLLGIQVVVTIHGVVPRKLANADFAEAFFIPKNPVVLKFALKILTTFICKIANVIIVHNNFARDTLNEDYHVSLQKIQVIPHGIGPTKSENLQCSNVDDASILFFGNITPSKGLETLIAAFERVRVPNAKLIIAGGPHPRGMRFFNRITRIVRSSSASEKISMTGYVPDESIHSLFAHCSLAVFPYNHSVSSSGGLSFALQHEKPVVVTDLPAFTEIVAHEQNGLVVPPEDSKALAEAIERILLDLHLRRALSRGTREKCSHLAWHAMAMRTFECYCRALSFSFKRK